MASGGVVGSFEGIQLGFQGLVIPEVLGGAGLGAVELGIVLEEMGRALYSGPFLSSAVMSVIALLESEDAALQAEILPAIADGRTLMTLALDEYDREGFDPGASSVRVRTGAKGTLLRGTKKAVVDGCLAESILVVAGGDDGFGLFLVTADAAGPPCLFSLVSHLITSVV